MTNRKAIVIEMNEVPLKILHHYQRLKPNSYIAQLLQESLVLTTEAKDVHKFKLYPSQTWGSLNTGTAYDQHKIHWYNDPKPQQYPLYWKIAADRGLKIGLVNTLHSSPADDYIDRENYRFVIPDCFASNNRTKPEIYTDFQALNTSATSENSRTATMGFPKQKALAVLAKYPALGIKSRTLVDAAGLVAKIKTGKVNKERLRNLQFTLLADIFSQQTIRQDVDLSIFFTNHIAANMHRYWYGLFPEDFKFKLYDEAWMGKFSQEIIESVRLFDVFLGRLIKYCQQNQRVLILVSSMGQEADPGVKETPKYSYRLKNIAKLLSNLCPGKRYEYQINAAMIPQYSLNFDSLAEAQDCFQQIHSVMNQLQSIRLNAFLNDKVITLDMELSPDAEQFWVAGKPYNYRELGCERIEIEDHHTGRHAVDGSLIIHNSSTSSATSDTVDYLEFAPAMLEFFGIGKPDYMMEPQFRI